MNLMKLFNINYLKQNLKKSKVVLSIFIGLIPILNTIILLMMITTNRNYVMDFFEVSTINLIGIYILPVIISICLFNYIYKKKSVDFINSMPISRKSIFFTNLISGILIFTSMLLVNVIVILVLTLIFNLQIPFMMLIDYFFFFLLVYIFVFSITNVAMSISGNAITQIIVTVILTFLIPFSSSYYNLMITNNVDQTLIECNEKECIPDNYYCYDNVDCNLNKQLNRYETRLNRVENNNYTTPYALLYGNVVSNHNIINSTSIIKMIILSIVYIILGYYLFLKRKMEVSETSFKNIHIHNIIKSLTLVPIMALAYEIFKTESLVFIIFILIILLIYYFIYDLITRKNITHIKLSLLYFVITIISLTSIYGIIDNYDNDNKVLKYTDFKEVSINLFGYSNNDNDKLYINDKKVINLVIKEMLSEREDNSTNYLTVFLKTKDNKQYKNYLHISNEKYDELVNLLSKNKDYVNYYKNINIDNVYALKLGDKLYNKKEAQDYLELINNTINKLSFKEYVELTNKYNNINEEYSIKLYSYVNHNKKERMISSYINYDLLNTIVNSNNKFLKENLTTEIPNDYSLYYINSYIKDIEEIDYYVLRSAKNDIYNFILKDINNKVDMRKEYITLQININGNSYQFTTNNIEEFLNILENNYNNIKDTDDYINYIDPKYKEKVEYYD